MRTEVCVSVISVYLNIFSCSDMQFEMERVLIEYSYLYKKMVMLRLQLDLFKVIKSSWAFLNKL